jgi:hypothetical protein
MSTEAPTMSRVKRWVALIALTIVVVALLAALGAISFAVRSTGEGADPDSAFSATEVVPEALAAKLSWQPDADGLVRVVEPATREQLASTWLRAHDALARAAVGDPSGIEIWFTDAARDQAIARFDDALEVAVDPVDAHVLRVEFYSLDGQVVVVTADESIRRAGATVEETFRAIIVLSDGNWRIRNIERVGQR